MKDVAAVDIDTINRFLGAIAFGISIVTAIGVWIGAPGKKVAASLDKVWEALKGHDRRIQAVEDEMKHLPTSDEFAELQIAVTRVQGDTKRIEETLGRVDHVVNRIDDYLRANR